ncbi:MAG: complex I NDUFA9 subunit family protein [Pelagibacterales bacterium]|nr:complex I NDUFA9 subunit family protein [Pelagibacterales bacterium]
MSRSKNKEAFLDLDKITIIGGMGFIGSQLAAKLSKFCKKIVILTRNKSSNSGITVLPNLEIIQVDINDERILKEYTKGSDILINLVGILNEFDKINTFKLIHYDLVKKISNAIQANKIKRFLHISSLNANPTSSSNYLKTKGMAEDFLLQNTSGFCKVTIFRPSIVFGEKDSFFNKFAKILKFSPIFPLACPAAKFMPIYIHDLTDFIIDSINDTKTYNTSIDVTGPKEYTFRELINLTLKSLRIRRLVIPLGDNLSKIQAIIFERLPGKLFSIDNYHSLKVDSISSEGFKGTTCAEDVVPTYLNRLKNKNHIEELRKKSGRKQ